jgi:hypothetical protein
LELGLVLSDLYLGTAVWIVDVIIVASLTGHRSTILAGMLIAATFLAAPLSIDAPGLPRLLLACFLAVPLFRAIDLMFDQRSYSFTERLAHLSGVCDSRYAARQAHRFDAAALGTFTVATLVLAAAVAAIRMTPSSGVWLVARWASGGIALLAFAEMATASQNLFNALFGTSTQPFMNSPYRSTSVSEFWTRRWNVPASEGLYLYCFAPLARKNAKVALVATFALSALGHTMLAKLALDNTILALACGLFFLLQPILIVVERRFRIRRWPTNARIAWTIAAMAVTSPLIIETLLRIIENQWSPASLAAVTAAAAFLMFLNTLIIFSSLLALNGSGEDLGVTPEAMLRESAEHSCASRDSA